MIPAFDNHHLFFFILMPKIPLKTSTSASLSPEYQRKVARMRSSIQLAGSSDDPLQGRQDRAAMTVARATLHHEVP